MRGFVMENEEFDEEGNETLKSSIRREMIQKLASEWNEYHQKIEQRGWMDPEERYQEQDYLSEQAEDAAYQAVCEAEEKAEKENLPVPTEEELSAIRTKAEEEFHAQVNAKNQEDHDRIAVIEELLGELGARMMRPYEHWNEEERYMEYMETRYDNDPDY